MHISKYICENCSRNRTFVNDFDLMTGDTMKLTCDCGHDMYWDNLKTENEIIYINGKMIIK